jgi:alanyl-tRNA synthetase
MALTSLLTCYAQSEVAITRAEALLSRVVRLPGGVQLLVQRLDGVDAGALGMAAQQLEKALGDPAAVVLGSAAADDKVCLAAAFSPSVVRQGASAGALLGPLAKLCGGGGGGKPAFAQAGGRDTARIEEALSLAAARISEIAAKAS